MKKNILITLLTLILSINISAHNWKVEWNTSGHFSVGSGSYLPFWQRTVEGGYMPYSSSGVLTTGVDLSFANSKGFFIDAGTNIVGSLAKKNEFNVKSANLLVDRLYASGGWKMLHLDVGMKPRHRELGDLSITGGNLVLSGYARNFPGINVWSDWIYFEKRHFIGIKGNFAHYQTIDTRHIQDAMIHNKSLAIKFGYRDIIELEAGLDHWVQWGGISPTLGKRPDSFKDFVRVMFGDNGGEDATMSDQLNALGNHLGREYVRLNYNEDLFRINLQYDMPYDDGDNIIQTQTFPDGVWSINVSSNKRDRIVTDITYEYIHTTWQSGAIHDRAATKEEMTNDYGKLVYWQDPEHFYYGRIVEGGRDNYFNNGEYLSGWTHYGRTVGLPLMIPYKPNSDGITMGIINNRIRAHHFGIKGIIAQIPYRFKATYSSNWGNYSYNSDLLFDNKPKQLSLALELEPFTYKHNLPLRYAIGAYCDWGEVYTNNIGISLRVFYQKSRQW